MFIYAVRDILYPQIGKIKTDIMSIKLDNALEQRGLDKALKGVRGEWEVINIRLCSNRHEAQRVKRLWSHEHEVFNI